MKKLKGPFLILIISVTLICFVNFGYVGKETKAYMIRDTVFASGMDLRFYNKVDRLYNRILFDLSPYENHGKPNGIPLVYGRYGKALNFDGSNDSIIIEDDDSLDLYDKMTLMAWIYPEGWGESNAGRIFDKQSSTAFALWVGYNGTITYGIRSSTLTTNEGSLTLNNGYHITATFDNSLSSDNMKIYVNAELQKTAERTTTIPPNAIDLMIGNRGGNDRTFNGTIDEVRIYPLALTESQIYHDMVTPIKKYPRVFLVQSRYATASWIEGNYSDNTGFVNNDPICYSIMARGNSYKPNRIHK